MSEKLYILDSIEVQPSDLNKYRHLSVVNKLPDNIVLPPPPPLRHENSIPHVNEFNNSTEEINSKNDFEMSNHYDEGVLVETKNISIVQNVRKLLKKYRKQRDQMRTKAKVATTSQHSFQTQNDHSNDLSTPLRSLSPAHDFDTEMTTAVDLSVNSREIIDEFIENLSMCTVDSGSGYDDFIDAEILQLTGDPITPTVDENKREEESSKEPLKTTDQVIETNETEVELKIAKDKKLDNEKDELDENETEKEEEIKEQIQEEEEKYTEIIDKNEEYVVQKAVDVVSIDTLYQICIESLNSKEFRIFFSENYINPQKEEDQMPDSPCKTENNASVDQIDKHHTEIDEVKSAIKTDSNLTVTEHEQENRLCHSVHVEQPTTSSVPSLRQLTAPIVRMHQLQISKNLKPLKLVFESESEKKSADCDSIADSSTNKVRTLQELAREVANTIYSFNVKPLQDLCKIALEKLNNLYVERRKDASKIATEKHQKTKKLEQVSSKTSDVLNKG